MKRDRTEKKSSLLLPALLALCLDFSLPKAASAACEDPGTATANVTAMQMMDWTYFNQFIQQETSFDWNNFSTAFEHLANAYITFGKNVLQALNDFSDKLDAQGDMATGLKAMTRELHASQVDQTYRLGQMQDAQLMTEEKSRADNFINEAQTRYAPSFLACEIDSTGPGLNRAYQISRALNRTLALDDLPRRANAAEKSTWPTINPSGTWQALPSTSFNGKGQDVNETYKKYVTKYCDNTMGDQGCAGPGLLAGRHKDLGALLWGTQLTIDPTNQENIRVIQDVLRFIIDPLAPDVIPQTVVPMPGERVAQAAQGRNAILARRAEMAYINTIYNTLGAMLSERVGGSRVNVSLMRAAAGIPTQNTASGTLPNVGASYRDIQEAMTRDRFDDPRYLVKMLSNPEQVMRERSTLGALRLQTMNDIYRRQEEMLFMESAGYGRDLNSQIPRAETATRPFQQ